MGEGTHAAKDVPEQIEPAPEEQEGRQDHLTVWKRRMGRQMPKVIGGLVLLVGVVRIVQAVAKQRDGQIHPLDPQFD